MVAKVAKTAKTSKKRFWGKKGSSNGIPFESGLEKKFIRICRQLGIKLERSRYKIGYKESGRLRKYYPDFYWPDVDFTVEIKGAWAFKSNSGFVREKYAASMVALAGRYTLLTEKELNSEFIIRLYRALLTREV